jgi:signal transduction histidine kinase
MTRTLSLTRAGLGVATIVMVAALLLTYRGIRQSESSNEWVDHTRRTFSALIGLEGTVGDLLFASNRADIDRASRSASDRLDFLSRLTLDNPEQHHRIEQLRTELDRITRARRDDSLASIADAGAQAVVPARLSHTMREIRQEELGLLEARLRTSGQTTDRLQSVLVVVALGASVLLASMFTLVIRDEKRVKAMHLLLRRTNEALEARVAARTTDLGAALDREHHLREEAEASSRSKDEFLMMVSHELRTPLTPILGWADMLRLGILPAEQRERAVKSIHENALVQKQLIADLLDTARILTGKLEIQPATIDLGALVQQAAEILRPAAEAKGLSLEVSIDERARAFVGDATRLRQVVWNLASNAVKFTSAGKVSIRLARLGADISLTVVDTGVGISKQFLPRAFDRFSQEKRGVTRPHGGLGLGLAIVRHLAELHGGTVRAESDGDGCGATFRVLLPCAQTYAHTSDERSPLLGDERMPALNGVCVLVVDDDQSVRHMVSVVLGACGAEVTSAASADEARRAMERRAPDVMLVDIAMPGEDGYAFIQGLRLRGHQRPIAALTALARPEDRAHALALGFDVHIAKPVDARALVQVVADLAIGVES